MATETGQYIVSARKYRPQTFDTVIGQQHITTTLKNTIRSGHLAHAYLFCGPRGVGKTTCARILARTLNCQNPTNDMEACGECSTCQAFKNNSALNIFELDAASNNSVEDIRRLTEQVRYAPQHGKYKIYIIDEVHMLSLAAFNAFLKTLEEPPDYAIFILATTEKHKILPTILSRCQIFDFKRIKPKQIVAHLQEIANKENFSAEDAALHIIAQKSEGCMRDALSMMDRLIGFANGNLTYEEVIEHLNILDAVSYFRFCELLGSKDIAGALLFLDELLQKGFEGDFIINGFSEHFRNLLLCKDVRMVKLLELPEAHKKQFYEYAQLMPDAYILSALSVLNDAELGYRNALNKRLHVELCLIRLCYLNDLVAPGLVQPVAATDDEAVKKKLNSVKEPEVSQTELSVVSEEPYTSEKKTPDSVDDKISPKNVLAFGAPTPAQSEISVDEKASPEAVKPFSATPPKPLPSLQKGKMSRNLLNALQEKNENTEEQKKANLSQDLAVSLFQAFKNRLKSSNLVLAEQMELMQVHFENAEELHLICNSEINFAYGKTAAKQYRAFVRKETGLGTLRVIATLDETAQPVAPTNKIKSRQEIFDDFMLRNPALKQLKQDLNLTIE